jgi:hypothetical protein
MHSTLAVYLTTLTILGWVVMGTYPLPLRMEEYQGTYGQGLIKPPSQLLYFSYSQRAQHNMQHVQHVKAVLSQGGAR